MNQSSIHSEASRPGQSRWSRAMSAFGFAIVAAVVTACGGGGDEGASTLNVSGSTPGSTAAAYAAGPITGLGSIIVNGVRYDDSAARVERDDDDSVHSSSSLKIGMMVEVSSSRPDDSTGRATASKIRFGSELVGPIEAADTSAGTITVLGQVIELKSTTVFDDSLSGGAAALTVGRVVEVHALYDAATTHFVATRVEDESSATFYRLRGVVANLDTTAKTFTINGTLISYANVATAALPATLANGLKVRVRLATAKAAGVWSATTVTTGVRRVDDSSDARLRGTVTVWTSAMNFEVNGLKVDASGATFEPAASAVVLGARVEVKGSTVNGVMVATKVEVKTEGERQRDWGRVELHGVVSALDTTAKTFVTREVTVDYSAVGEWKDGAAADLANGRRLEVKGAWSSDRRSLKAASIEFES